MSTAPGQFIWYELLTTDPDAATAFYQHVVGWTVRDAGMSNVDYRLLSLDGPPTAGLMPLPEAARKAGARPGWIGYIAADDVDAMTNAAVDAGGALHRAPDDIPGVGRFSVLADPQGAAFALLRWSAPQNWPPVPGTTRGQVMWHELMANDWKAAFDFYSKMFGWTKGDPFDMGPMGIYQLFTSGGDAIGGMFDRPPNVPAPFWLYYFNVGDIDSAAERIREKNGQILMGPQEVPGGGWIIQGLDPQGAMFALVGNKGG